jgi:hypothetical protein
MSLETCLESRVLPISVSQLNILVGEIGLTSMDRYD